MSSQALPAQAKQLFHYLFEQASLGIAVEDLEGKLLLANPALCSMLGYREDELCGMSCSQFDDPENSQDEGVLFQQLRAGVIDKYSLEKRYVRKHGGELWGRLNVSLCEKRGWRIPARLCLCGGHHGAQAVGRGTARERRTFSFGGSGRKDVCVRVGCSNRYGRAIRGIRQCPRSRPSAERAYSSANISHHSSRRPRTVYRFSRPAYSTELDFTG